MCRWAAARPRVVRAASFARRVASKPGQAPPPPTGTAADPSGALHTCGAGCASGRRLASLMVLLVVPLVFQAPEAPAARETRQPRFARCRVSKPARALRSLRRPPHQWGLVCWRVVRCVVSTPGRIPRLDVFPILSFACNSPATLSNREFTTLELQRFQTLLKLHPIELHAKFGGGGVVAAQGVAARRCRPGGPVV